MDLNDAIYVISNLFNVGDGVLTNFLSLLFSEGAIQLSVLFFSYMLFLAVDTSLKSNRMTNGFIGNKQLRWFCYYILVMMLILINVPNIKPQFLYFAF